MMNQYFMIERLFLLSANGAHLLCKTMSQIKNASNV